MARKVETFIVGEDGGRDKGKQFVLTEMASDQGEQWAIRALLALSSAGVDLPPGAAQAGFAGVATAGVEAFSKLRYEDAKPLLDEMFECVQFKPNIPNVAPRPVMGGENGDIEEVKTRFLLRMAVLRLHINFSTAAAPPTTGSPSGTSATAG